MRECERFSIRKRLDLFFFISYISVFSEKKNDLIVASQYYRGIASRD